MNNEISSKEMKREILELLVESNQMIRRHAEERSVMLMKIRKIAEKESEELDISSSEYISSTVEKMEDDQSMDIDSIDSLNEEFSNLQKVRDEMQEIEAKKQKKEELIDEIMQIDANLLARDELIEILEEYVEMEEAQIQKLVAEYSEAQEEQKLMEDKMKLIDSLSRNDPRMKALEIINQHPEGISKTQLTYMMNSSPYQARKIINELKDADLISINEESQLITLESSTSSPEQLLVQP